MPVSKKEFLWREWVLGRERFANKGPRSQPRPDVGYGGPGQKPVPKVWWRRLEEFLTPDDKEPDTPPTKAKPGQLTRHFNVSEFACHDGRKVPPIAVPALTRLCVQYLEPMRAKYGPCRVLSGYRPRDYNRKIGGAPLSQHIYELTPGSVAADLVFSSGTPAQWAEYANRLGAGGVGRYDRAGFVHVDNRPNRARWTG